MDATESSVAKHVRQAYSVAFLRFQLSENPAVSDDEYERVVQQICRKQRRFLETHLGEQKLEDIEVLSIGFLWPLTATLSATRGAAVNLKSCRIVKLT